MLRYGLQQFVSVNTTNLILFGECSKDNTKKCFGKENPLNVQQGWLSVAGWPARCRVPPTSPVYSPHHHHTHTLSAQQGDGRLAVGLEAPLTNLASRCPSYIYSQSCTALCELHAHECEQPTYTQC